MISRFSAPVLIGAVLVLFPARASRPASPRPVATPAPASGWVFDRLTWSPGGESLAVEAAEYRASGDRFARVRDSMTLIVDARSGLLTLPAEARAFQLDTDRRGMLVLGGWGLWHMELDSGRTRQVHLSPPGGGANVYDFAFDRTGGVMFLIGAVGDTAGGLYRSPAGEPPVLSAPFRPGGPAVPSLWTDEARPNALPQVMNARGPRVFRIGGFDGEFRYDGRTLVLAPSVGTPTTIADAIEIDWASWPPGGRVGVVSVHESGSPGSGDVFRVLPGIGPRRILDGSSSQIAWLNDHRAVMNDSEGRLFIYDALNDSLEAFPLYTLPAWSTHLNPAAEAPTLRVEHWPLSARDEDSRRALLRKCERELRGETELLSTVLRAGDADPRGGIEGVGAFPSLAAADRVRPALEKRGMKAHPTVVAVTRLWGEFDFGHVSGDTGVTAFVRRPGADLPFTEVWLSRPDETPRRLLSTRIVGS